MADLPIPNTILLKNLAALSKALPLSPTVKQTSTVLRSLIKMVADRRTHLKYLERTNKTRYNAIMKKIELV